jgi:hypothetical protein
MKATTLFVLLLAGATAGCGDDPTAPATRPDLAGSWSYSFTVFDTAACVGAPPDFVTGCGGSGTLDLAPHGPLLGGAWTMRGGCQNCGMAWDFFDDGELEAGWTRTALDFAIRDFSFHADLPPAPIDTLRGTVSSPWEDRVAHGTWIMTRAQ